MQWYDLYMQCIGIDICVIPFSYLFILHMYITYLYLFLYISRSLFQIHPVICSVKLNSEKSTFIYYRHFAVLSFSLSFSLSFRTFVLLFCTFYRDFREVKHRTYRLVLSGGSFKVEMLQVVEIFRFEFSYILTSWAVFSVTWVPTVNKICINKIFWTWGSSYGISLLNVVFHYVTIFARADILGMKTLREEMQSIFISNAIKKRKKIFK